MVHPWEVQGQSGCPLRLGSALVFFLCSGIQHGAWCGCESMTIRVIPKCDWTLGVMPTVASLAARGGVTCQKKSSLSVMTALEPGNKVLAFECLVDGWLTPRWHHFHLPGSFFFPRLFSFPLLCPRAKDGVPGAQLLTFCNELLTPSLGSAVEADA